MITFQAFYLLGAALSQEIGLWGEIPEPRFRFLYGGEWAYRLGGWLGEERVTYNCRIGGKVEDWRCGDKGESPKVEVCLVRVAAATSVTQMQKGYWYGDVTGRPLRWLPEAEALEVYTPSSEHYRLFFRPLWYGERSPEHHWQSELRPRLCEAGG
jgi:hypothetical protein